MFVIVIIMIIAIINNVVGAVLNFATLVNN